MNNQVIKANYHTHTKRCGHACGEDREYVEAAIEAGLEILGFSDHTPYPTNSDFHSGMRISLSQAEGYFSSITALKKEYEKDIQIYVGVEAEYFPEHFEKLLDFMKDYPLDYMILGEHFVPDEEHGIYMGAPFTQKEFLDAYVENVIAAICSKKFLYVAHPDLPNYVGTDEEEALSEAMLKICRAAKENNVPIEINMLGHTRSIQYPSERMLCAAEKCKNDMVIGMDIHNPKHFFNEEAVKECVAMAKRHGLNVLETLVI